MLYILQLLMFATPENIFSHFNCKNIYMETLVSLTTSIRRNPTPKIL